MVDIGIHSLAYRLPEGRQRTQDLVIEGKLSRGEYLALGVESVPVLRPDQTILDLAEGASREAIDQAGVPASDIDLLIYFSATYQNSPSVSNAGELQHRLGLGRCPVLGVADVNCAGFHCALEVVSGTMASDSSCQVALLVGADSLKARYVPMGAIMSDSASAVVVRRGWPVNQLLLTRWRTIGLYHDLYEYDRSVGGFRIRNKEKLQEFKRNGILYRHILGLASDSLEELGIRWNELRYVVFENYSLSFQNTIASVLPIVPEQLYFDDLSLRGHAGCSDIVISYSRLLEQMGPQPGDKVMLFSLGLGHTWACSILEH